MPIYAIDAAILWSSNVAYLFRDSKYVRFDVVTNSASELRAINPANWGGMPFMNVDAAIDWGNGTAYLFSGNNYVSYDIATDVASAVRTIKGNWPGVVWR